MKAWLAAVLLLGATTACAAGSHEPQAASRPLAEEPQVKLGEKPVDPAVARERAVERARKHLSEKLGVPTGEVKLVSAKAMTWSDTSLGCPEPDRMYAQVLVDGHEVLLEAQGETHRLHVSRKRIVVCIDKAPRLGPEHSRHSQH